MAWRFLRRLLPNQEKIRNHKQLRFFGERLYDPKLWHLNRRSVATALGLGIFFACLPCLGQPIMAAAAALWLRINLPVAVFTVLVTNPLTMAPVFYFNYRLGAWMLGLPVRPFDFEMSLEWLLRETGAIWLPLIVGCLTMGLLVGVTVYGLVNLCWRFYVIRKRRTPLKLRLHLKDGKSA